MQFRVFLRFHQRQRNHDQSHERELGGVAVAGKGGLTPEPEKPPSLAVELGVKTVSVTDKAGKTWECPPLDLEDLADLEGYLGPASGWLWEGFSVKIMRAILWASLRKAGKTPKEIEDRKFTLPLPDTGKMFDAGFATQLGDVVLELLGISGFNVQKRGGKVTGPGAGGEPETSTGKASSGSPSPSVTASAK